jgi:hypothetical protein
MKGIVNEKPRTELVADVKCRFTFFFNKQVTRINKESIEGID